MIQYNIRDNIKDVSKWLVDITYKYTNDKIATRIAEIFVERAQNKIRSSGALKGDIQQFVDAITYKKIGEDHYRIYAGRDGDDQLKDDMYYLEFGTGIAGKYNSHPDANKIGWEYDVNNHGAKGWWYTKSADYENEDSFTAVNDWQPSPKKETYNSIGVIAIRYFYDTMHEMGSIINQALREVGD